MLVSGFDGFELFDAVAFSIHLSIITVIQKENIGEHLIKSWHVSKSVKMASTMAISGKMAQLQMPGFELRRSQVQLMNVALEGELWHEFARSLNELLPLKVSFSQVYLCRICYWNDWIRLFDLNGIFHQSTRELQDKAKPISAAEILIIRSFGRLSQLEPVHVLCSWIGLDECQQW